MKKILEIGIIFTLCVFVFNLFAENYDYSWAVKAGGSMADYGYGIAADSHGNCYIVGYFKDIAIFGDITLNSAGEEDIFIAKLDPAGNFLWAKRAGGTGTDVANAIAVTNGGNCYITGDFSGTADFGDTSLTSAGRGDIFVAKLDSDGNWLWAVSHGSSGHDTGYGIGIDDAGNCYVTGETSPYGTKIRVFIGKWDTHGVHLWHDFGGAFKNAYGRAIAVSSTGDCYITGDFFYSITFGEEDNQVSIGHGNQTDMFVAKIGPGGNWKWAKRAGGSAADAGWGISLDSEENCYVTGVVPSADADFGRFNVSGASGKIFVAKLNFAGNWEWVAQAGKNRTLEMSYGIVADSWGNCYVTGMFDWMAHFGEHTINGQGQADIFVAKIDASGAWQWAKQAGGIWIDRGFAIALDNAGNCFATGNIVLSAGFGSITLNTNGAADIFVTKLTPVYAYLPLAPQPLQLDDETLVTIEIISGAGFDAGDIGLYPPVNNPNGVEHAFALFGYGIQSFDISTDLQWGAAYFGGDWHSYQNEEGKISFQNVDFGSAKGGVPIVLGDEDSTLPVTLSSFTAVISNGSSIKLCWTTESETGVLGYRVYRNSLPDLDTALVISTLIQAQNSSSQSFYSYEDGDTDDYGTYYYWLQGIDFNDYGYFFGPISITLMQESEPVIIPEPITQMHKVFPNPFNPNLIIPFYLVTQDEVTITIFNVKGQRVKRLDLGSKDAGNHQIAWDGKSDAGMACTSGIYQIVLQAGTKYFHSKAVLMK